MWKVEKSRSDSDINWFCNWLNANSQQQKKLSEASNSSNNNFWSKSNVSVFSGFGRKLKQKNMINVRVFSRPLCQQLKPNRYFKTNSLHDLHKNV